MKDTYVIIVILVLFRVDGLAQIVLALHLTRDLLDVIVDIKVGSIIVVIVLRVTITNIHGT